MDENLKIQILSIPGEEGFQSKAARHIYLLTAEKLLSAGIEEDEILDLLKDLYSVTIND